MNFIGIFLDHHPKVMSQMKIVGIIVKYKNTINCTVIQIQ